MKLSIPDPPKSLHLATQRKSPELFDLYSEIVGPSVAPSGSMIAIDIPGDRGPGFAIDTLSRELEVAELKGRSVLISLGIRGPYGAVNVADGEERDAFSRIREVLREHESVSVGIRVGHVFNVPANHCHTHSFAENYQSIVGALGRDSAAFGVGVAPGGKDPEESGWWPGNDVVDFITLDVRNPLHLPVAESMRPEMTRAMLFCQSKGGRVLLHVSAKDLNLHETIESGLDQDRIWIHGIRYLAGRLLGAKFGGVILDTFEGRLHENPVLWGRWLDLLRTI